MSIEELKLNTAELIKSKEKPEVVEFEDRSEMLFAHMNIIAYNNRIELKL